MDALNIDKGSVEHIILKGMKWKEKDSGKWHANMAGVECVFIKKGEKLFAIIVYQN